MLDRLRIKVEHSSKYKPTKNKEGFLVGETMQITAQGSTNFIITPDIFFIDEEAPQRPLKEFMTLDLALFKIPTKVLYKLQISVVQEIQSRARSDAMNL
jgi:hypothetical protein